MDVGMLKMWGIKSEITFWGHPVTVCAVDAVTLLNNYFFFFSYACHLP